MKAMISPRLTHPGRTRRELVPTPPPFPAPMLAKPAKAVPLDSAFGYEFKWDGIRLLAYVDRGSLQLRSRNGLDVLRKYPELHGLRDAVGRNALLLDGELVSLDENFVPRFHLLQQRLGETAEGRPDVTYMIFDILYRNGQSLMSRPYVERREILSGLNLNGRDWHTPDYLTGTSLDILHTATDLGLEGIVAKRLDSLYLPGQRTDAWLKLKIRRRQEFVIGGWQPGQGSRAGFLGSVLLGYFEPKRRGIASRKLIYAGECGSGFSEDVLRELKRSFEQNASATCPFDLNAPTGRALREAKFVKPRLIAEVEFTEWTPGGLLRHPVSLGLRNDKRPSDVVREEV